MSFTENLDRLLTDSGSYAVYGKHLGDKMRAGVQYGPDPVKPPRPLYSVYDTNPNRARIAEIDREIDELKAQLASYDMEDEIAQYKFLYENDPNYLSQYRQHKSTEQMNAEMRKATEAANKASNIQAAWKQNGIDLEMAKYDVLAAKHVLDEANKAADSEAIKRANTDLERAKAKYNRVFNENKTVKDHMMKLLGISEVDEAELEDAASKLLDNTEDKQKVNNSTVTDDVADAEAIQKLYGELNRLDKAIIVDNIAINKKDKINMIKEWKKSIEDAKSKINNSKLSVQNKQEYLNKLADLERKVHNFAKPANKGGQREVIVKDKAYYQKLTEDKNDIELSKLGYATLIEAKKSGIPISDRALKLAKKNAK